MSRLHLLESQASEQFRDMLERGRYIRRRAALLFRCHGEYLAAAEREMAKPGLRDMDLVFALMGKASRMYRRHRRLIDGLTRELYGCERGQS